MGRSAASSPGTCPATSGSLPASRSCHSVSHRDLAACQHIGLLYVWQCANKQCHCLAVCQQTVSLFGSVPTNSVIVWQCANKQCHCLAACQQTVSLFSQCANKQCHCLAVCQQTVSLFSSVPTNSVIVWQCANK